MNERDLRYFVAIVDCRGIGAAAQRLGVTQPAVTKCVDRLEDVLRTPLLSRKGRYVELTPAGILFHRRRRQFCFGWRMRCRNCPTMRRATAGTSAWARPQP